MPPRSGTLVALCVLGLWQGGAYAQTPSATEQAEALNAEGKELIKQLDLVGAAQRFRAAMALSGDPRFAFNLCYTLEKSGQLVEAKQACETVMESGNARLNDKANRLLAVIEESMAAGAPQTPARPPGPGGSLRPTAPAKPVPSVPSTPPPKKHKASYGLTAGLSRATVQGTFEKTDAKLGLAFGGGMRMRIRPSFESILDVQFVQRGFNASFTEIMGVESSITGNYVDVGFASRWYLGTEGFQPYAEVGMALSVLLFDSASIGGEEVEADLQPFDVSYSLGLGSSIALGSRSLDLRVRYMYGLLNAFNSEGLMGDPPATAYNRTLLVQSGIWF